MVSSTNDKNTKEWACKVGLFHPSALQTGIGYPVIFTFFGDCTALTSNLTMGDTGDA